MRTIISDISCRSKTTEDFHLALSPGSTSLHPRRLKKLSSLLLQISVGIGQDKLEDKLAHRSVGPLRRPELA